MSKYRVALLQAAEGPEATLAGTNRPRVCVYRECGPRDVGRGFSVQCSVSKTSLFSSPCTDANPPFKGVADLCGSGRYKIRKQPCLVFTPWQIIPLSDRAPRRRSLAGHWRSLTRSRRTATTTATPGSTPPDALHSVGMADHDRVNRMFDCIDADKSGEIDSTELMMHLLGLGQEHESVSELFKVLDTDGDGKISRKEFTAGFDKVTAFQRRQPDASAGEAAAEAAAAATFAAVDADKSGKLDLEELLSALAAAGDDADRAEVEALFKRLDVNGDGAITMEEWRAGHSGGGLRARLAAAMKRGQLSLPPPDEDDEPEPEGRDTDGVLFAAEQAAKAIRELDPPDPAHPDDRLAAARYAELWSDGCWGISPWHGQPDEAEKHEATLRWLQGALELMAAHDAKFKRPLLYVITSPRLWPDHHNPEEPGFAQLKAFAGAKLDALGDAAERDIYAALGLGPKLDGVCADVVNVHPRQDVHAGLPASADGEDDAKHIFKLLIAAHALDPGFQAKAAAAFGRAGGTGAGKPPAVKGLMRMMAKLGTDHADAAEPKAYENADTNRVAWVLEDADQLIKAEAEARTELGAPIRCKNNYQVAFDASLTKGYRAMLCNYVYDPKKTWGELESEVKEAAVVVKRLVCGVFAGMGADEDQLAPFVAGIDKVAAEFGVDVREPGWEGVLAGMGKDEEDIAEWGAQFDEILAESGAKSPAKLVVEIQFMTKEYYAMRKKTHAWYKVVRSDHAVGMATDYSGGL
eukprot:scaffold22481_cov49-Phaeocystis_antarctica.AAC.3